MKDLHIVKNCDGGKRKPCLVHFELGCLTGSNLTAVVAVAAVAYFFCHPNFQVIALLGTLPQSAGDVNLFFSLFTFLGLKFGVLKWVTLLHVLWNPNWLWSRLDIAKWSCLILNIFKAIAHMWCSLKQWTMWDEKCAFSESLLIQNRIYLRPVQRFLGCKHDPS